MPLSQFTDEAYEGLAAGNEEVAVGNAQQWYARIELARQGLFHDLAEATKKEV